MSLSDIQKASSILSAIEQFNSLGRDKFLSQYGFGRSREYFLVHKGRHYDSKAIVGVAHQFEFPEEGQLHADNFSGGELTVRRKLEELGFTVERITAAESVRQLSISLINEIAENSLWRRSDIHDLLGGNRQAGISTPANSPNVLIFSGPRDEGFGYQDEWKEDGFFHYTGEGQVGDMEFVRGNKAIRDHAQNGRILLLFEEVSDGRRRFIGPMSYVDDYTKTISDKDGNQRQGIIFRLARTNISTAIAPDQPETQEALGFASTRADALEASQDVTERVRTSQEHRVRSRKVAKYVQERALGYCEVCGYAAPFETRYGRPYLETHHITQVADDGPDAPQHVVAACPTCHPRIHHGIGGDGINEAAHERVIRVEEAIDEDRLLVVTADIIRDEEGRILVAKRHHSDHLGEMWEFPGGKVEEGETLEECLRREILEELNVHITEPERFYMVDHRYTEFDIRLCGLTANIQDGELELNNHLEAMWVRPEDLLEMDLAPADVGMVKALNL